MERAGQIRMVGGVVAFAFALLLLVASPALGSDWAEHPLGGEAASSPLYGISCPTTSLCVAVGGNNTIASSTEPLAPGGWQAVYVGEGVSAGNPNQRLIKGVSCPTTHLCVAVGFLGNILTSTEPTGAASAWQVTDFDPSGPNTHFYGVSCPTTSFCVAVAGGGAIATSTNPTGGAGAWSLTQLAEPLELRGVSCNSPSFCVAVGDSGTEIRPSPNNLGEVVSSTAPSASLWQQAELPGSHGSLYGVSCPTTTLCVSGDMFGNVVGTTTPTGPASGWITFPTSVSVQITGASCSSPGRCLLVDNNGDVLTASEPLGGTHAWTSQNLIPFSTEPLVRNALYGASCPAPGFCAVGGVGKVLTSVDPSAPPTPQAPQGGGGGSKGKKPNKNKVRPKRPRVIMYSGVPNELPIPAGKAFLQFRFHVKRKFQVRGFVCSFGPQKLHRCRSPRRFRVGPGHYRFRVRAVGWTGLRGPAAEQRIWVCLRPGAVRLAGC